MQRLGARSIPIVSRGDKFVFAQVLQDVVDFLEIDDDTGPKLTPTELGERYLSILDKAIAQTRQMPDEHLTKELPNRPRSWLVLMHHVFQIPTSFLDMEETGAPLTYQGLIAPPPEGMKTAGAVAEFGEAAGARFNRWWETAKNSDFDAEVEPYFGKTSRHELLERTVWHSTQHVRQVASLLEQAGVVPEQPLSPADIGGLPLTEKIWDEAPA